MPVALNFYNDKIRASAAGTWRCRAAHSTALRAGQGRGVIKTARLSIRPGNYCERKSSSRRGALSQVWRWSSPPTHCGAGAEEGQPASCSRLRIVASSCELWP